MSKETNFDVETIQKLAKGVVCPEQGNDLWPDLRAEWNFKRRTRGSLHQKWLNTLVEATSVLVEQQKRSKAEIVERAGISRD